METMAGQIRITPDQMRSRANEYRVEADNVGNVISRMDTLLNALQSVKAQDLINEIAQSLDATAQTLEETDANIASAFRG